MLHTIFFFDICPLRYTQNIYMIHWFFIFPSRGKISIVACYIGTYNNIICEQHHIFP